MPVLPQVHQRLSVPSVLRVVLGIQSEFSGASGLQELHLCGSNPVEERGEPAALCVVVILSIYICILEQKDSDLSEVVGVGTIVGKGGSRG